MVSDGAHGATGECEVNWLPFILTRGYIHKKHQGVMRTGLNKGLLANSQAVGTESLLSNFGWASKSSASLKRIERKQEWLEASCHSRLASVAMIFLRQGILCQRYFKFSYLAWANR